MDKFDKEFFNGIYPDINNDKVNIYISRKKEFIDNNYKTYNYDNIKEVSESECKYNSFQLAPHQTFVKKFISTDTPYKSLLLYHGLGTGKTCSAISICENMREYMKRSSLYKKILIIASPKLIENFKNQLFNPTKLKVKDNKWYIESSCIGNTLLREIDPYGIMNAMNTKKEKIILLINKLINEYYEFMGIMKLANDIQNIKNKWTSIKLDEKSREEKITSEIKNKYDMRLMIIDEIHNVRSSNVKLNDHKKSLNMLKMVLRSTKSMKLVLLSATPMYNNHIEIVQLINYLLLNDNKPEIKHEDIFDKNDILTTDGKNRLINAIRGYISFIRGENVMTFPFRLFPSVFDKDNSLLENINKSNSNIKYPNKQINGVSIKQPIKYTDIFYVKVDGFQEFCYMFGLYASQKQGFTRNDYYDEGEYDEGEYDEGEYDEGKYDEGEYDEGEYDEGDMEGGTNIISKFKKSIMRKKSSKHKSNKKILSPSKKYIDSHKNELKLLNKESEKYKKKSNKKSINTNKSLEFISQLPQNKSLSLIKENNNEDEYLVTNGTFPNEYKNDESKKNNNNPNKNENNTMNKLSVNEDVNVNVNVNEDEDVNVNVNVNVNEDEDVNVNVNVNEDEDVNVNEDEDVNEELNNIGMSQQYLGYLNQLLNIVYPNDYILTLYENYQKENNNNNNNNNISVNDYLDRIFGGDVLNNSILSEIIGEKGMQNICRINKTGNIKSYSYISREKSDHIFSKENIGRYSKKIDTIVNRIQKSTGVVLVYSQYIHSGCIPLALTLESCGYTNYTDNTLLNTRYIDSSKKNNLKYVMITGSVKSKELNKIMEIITSDENKNGEKIKVVIISDAGTEGLDFKFIRQVHIMDAWYNHNRNQQIIGRAIRYCSHSQLEFEKRNTEIYIYGTILSNALNNEAVDMYLYRHSEKKSIEIGKITRLLKENSIDCLLTNDFNLMDKEVINKIETIELSTKSDIDEIQKIEYKVGDEPFTEICDYQEKCSYQCANKKMYDNFLQNDKTLDDSTYHIQYIEYTIDNIIDIIKRLYMSKFIYKYDDLVEEINKIHDYTEYHIKFALQFLLDNNNEIIYDIFKRSGYLTKLSMKEPISNDITELYVFIPNELSENKYTSYINKKDPLKKMKRRIILPNVVEQTKKKENTNNKSAFIADDILKIKTNESFIKINNKLKNNSQIIGKDEKQLYDLLHIYKNKVNDIYVNLLTNLHFEKIMNIDSNDEETNSNIRRIIIYHMIDKYDFLLKKRNYINDMKFIIDNVNNIDLFITNVENVDRMEFKFIFDVIIQYIHENNYLKIDEKKELYFFNDNKEEFSYYLINKNDNDNDNTNDIYTIDKIREHSDFKSKIDNIKEIYNNDNIANDYYIGTYRQKSKKNNTKSLMFLNINKKNKYTYKTCNTFTIDILKSLIKRISYNSNIKEITNIKNIQLPDTLDDSNGKNKSKRGGYTKDKYCLIYEFIIRYISIVIPNNTENPSVDIYKYLILSPSMNLLLF